jgi:outer membrane protein insertion porin family
MFVQYAGGILGGEPNFVKSVADSAWYFPVIWDTVFMMRGRIGFVQSVNELPVPTEQRFFVGGASTVRGYHYGSLSPVEIAPDGIVYRIGGVKELMFNFEYTFPIVQAARLKGLLFYDMGKGFDDGQPIDVSLLRHSYGWGFYWLSPMGPLRFEWGYIVNQKPYDQRNAFEFSMGTTF